jgi:hypothetical protein
MKYIPESIKAAIEADREALFAPYAIGRPDNWSCDMRTKDLICIGNWLANELTLLGISDVDRRTQQWKFNRESRSDLDLFTCAADIMNEAVEGKIEQNRIYHRRWG